MSKKFFVTTPIYYVNDRPHIGHLCTTLAADILARYHRLLGEKVFFLTGTDEHGAKIAEAAKENQQSPKDYCDQLAVDFERNWKKLNLSYDFFIRTTDPRHEKFVSKFIEKIYKNGDIYKGKYEGLYCIGCEKFLTDSELIDGCCPYHPSRKPIRQVEENYFFRLSKYQKEVEKIIQKNIYHLVPENKKRETLNKIKKGLDDLSISRASVSWGIPLPWDKSQTIYVWFEALLNYFTATQFLNGKDIFWPPDLHIVGKEISWFHAVIWPAMLLSAELPLPKKLFIHSFYISRGQKMSKSIGNIIQPKQLINEFGLEATRYLIASTFPHSDDSDITMEYFKEKYNADLANGIGNLVQRVSVLCQMSNVKCQMSKPNFKFQNYNLYNQLLEEYKFNEALVWIWEKINKLDKYVNDNKPWEKQGNERKIILEKPIFDLLEIAFLLQPFLPQTSQKITEIFFSERIKAPTKPLFPRI